VHAAPGYRDARVALGHDYLLVMRGAERTFAAMADRYPDAPILTLLYDEGGTDGRFRGRTITTSPLQRLGIGQDGFRRLLPLYPWATRRLKAPLDADVLLTSSSAFAHAIRTPPGAIHVCYCHSPFRYAWHEQDRALAELPAPLRPALKLMLARLRRWDRAASRRVDLYIANSAITQERLRTIYGREAPIVHPPVETTRFAPGSPRAALLVVSEVVRHKRLDVALDAARMAGVPIQVVGSGPDLALLSESYPEAEFLGRVADLQLAELYAGARAVLVPGTEEFGITAVEAQASGRPVIASAAGGALETVLDKVTGRLVTPGDPRAFAAAIGELDELRLDPAAAVRNAERFSVAAFQRRLAEEVDRAVEAHRVRRPIMAKTLS
jgi:glycosyltransferase involved in cell wall biosynthesis